MIIEEVRLHDYKRLDLLGITDLTYTPHSAYQLFTGKNGIGKSSLLSEFSPLPCENTDLREGGYKYIKINHRGNTYEIRYDMGKKLDASFKRNNEELNPGGTIKVQRQLIWEHFSYGEDIHDVLLGNTLLSNMSPQMRREWFVRMSKSDMNYAIALFNRLKSVERDLKGAIKLNKQRLVSEQAKLLSVEEREKLTKERERLNHELSTMLQFVSQGLEDKSQQLMELHRKLEDTANRIIDFNFTLIHEGVKNEPTLQKLKTQYQFELDRLRNEYKQSVDSLTELQDIINKNKQLTDKPISVLQLEIDNVKKELSDLTHQFEQYNVEVGQQAEEQQFEYTRVYQALKECLTYLVKNPMTEEGTRYFTREKYQTLTSDLEQLTETQIRLVNQLEYHKRELTNLNNIHDVHCPNCQFEFKPGVNCNQMNELKRKIEVEEVTLAETNKHLDKLRMLKSEYDTWLSGMKRYRQIQEQYPLFNPLFTHLQKFSEMLFENPISLAMELDRYQRVLALKCDIMRLTEIDKQLSVEYVKRMAAEGSDMEYIMKTYREMEARVESLDKSILSLVGKMSDVEKVLYNHQQFSEKASLLSQYTQAIRQMTFDQIRYKNNVKLKGYIQEKQAELAMKETVLNQLHQTESVIEQLTKMIEQNEEERKAINVLTTLLSPQDGLIAESLLGFLNLFLDEMANMISHIWSYQMRPYMEIGEEGIDLDYRFKVEIENVEDPVKEISKLSRGQKEIMDFTFKLLLMQHLAMQDYPVFMDEVGGSFDNYHRDRLYQYIKALVEDNQISQVFIISHIANSHDALSLADKNVLDTDASMIDDEANKYLIMK